MAISDSQSRHHLDVRRHVVRIVITAVAILLVLIVVPLFFKDYETWHGVSFAIIAAIACVINLIEPKDFAERSKAASILLVAVVTLLCLGINEFFNSGSLQTIFLNGESFHIGIFLLNALLLVIMQAIIAFAFRSWKVACEVMAIAVFAFSLTGCIVSHMRGTPFVMSDIMSAFTAASVAKSGMTIVFPSIMFVNIALLMLALTCCRFLPRRMRHAQRRPLRKVVHVLVSVGLVAVFCGGALLLFSVSTIPEDVFGFERTTWKPLQEYRHNGFAASFISHACDSTQLIPTGYSDQSAVDTVGKTLVGSSYEEGTSTDQLYAELEDELAATSDVQPNIVFIQDESLSDFETCMANGSYNEEALPYLHALEQNGDASTGTFATSVHGGMTIYTEWEVLSGTSAAFVANNRIYHAVPSSGSSSIVSTLASQGYTCIATHPCKPSDYNRGTAFANLGFDEFYSLSSYDENDTYGDWISDQATFDKVYDLLTEDDGPLFVFDVTMQNHIPYDEVTTDSDPIDYQAVRCLEHSDDTELSTYLTLAHESDRAINEFLDKVACIDEPTIVVIYGDHQPDIGENIADWMSGTSHDGTGTVSDWQRQYETPLVIWNNFGKSNKNIGTISANYLSAYVLDYAGLEMTPYDAYLLKLRERYPAVTSRIWQTSDGTYHGWDRLSRSNADLLGYYYLQYNMLFAKDGRQSLLFETPSEAQAGGS